MYPVQFIPPARFRVLRRLGEGGMGVVYEAVDRERGVRVALKTLRSTSNDGIARFKREFRALQDLQHKNLVSLGELYAEQGTWFFTMELIEGFDFLEYVRPSDPARAQTGLDALAHTELRTAEHENAAAPSLQMSHASLNGRTTVSNAAVSSARMASAGADEKRLRDALTQLSRALLVLHDAHKVHRDIKPSNIRVTPDGRVVLLDFGVVLEVDPNPHTTELKVVGTAAYMAPEQAAAKIVGPEADWYSVGCLLYQSLTGCLPFTGAALQILMAKQRSEPEPPRNLVPSVPADLDALCVELLRFEPSARPTGRQVYKRLQSGATAGASASDSARPPPMTTTSSQTAEFVGRAAHLQVLRSAFDKTRAGSAVTIFLEGESGVGKSALVRHFVELVVAEGPAVILTGRCRERESVPYKAFDGIIDALSLTLPKLPNWTGLLPVRADLLAQVFPALKRIEVIAAMERRGRDVVDPLEQRSRVFAACRDLFTRLAIRHPAVIVIDDLQWADADSLALLAEIMRPPDPPPLLLLTTTRLITRSSLPPDASANGAPKRQVAHGLEGDVRHQRVEPLNDEEAHELAGLLTRRASQSSAVDTAAIVREANGHPLFIDELVRHAALGEQTGAVRLDDALWARISRLEDSARYLVQLIAVAGMPMHVEALARGAQMDVSQANKELSLLRVANLVRTTGGYRPDVAEPYHDRVREAVLAKLSPEEKRGLHRRIAIVLESEEHPDPEALSVHWREAGDDERAATYAERAGIAAEAALAFDHAARLFRGALDLRKNEGPEALASRVRLATALANAGLCADAAREYELAATRSSDADAVDLRRRAAEQLLRAGLIDEGLVVTGVVLAALGMRLPRTPFQAMLAYLYHRMLLWFRGLQFTERHTSLISQRELQVVDVCWSLSFSLSLVDTIRGGDFQARNLLLALKVGEPYRVARALAMETSFGASMGGDTWEQTEKKIERAGELSRRVGNPHAIAWSTATAGCAAYLAGRFKVALAQLDEAQAQLRECTGAWSEIVRARTFALNALAQLGDIEELGRRMTLYLREAQEHGDLHAATNFRIGYATLAWLARDNAAGAHADTADAMRHWSKGGFHLEHYYALLSHVQADLYDGQGRAAWERVTEAWSPLERSFLLRVQRVRVHARYVRARAAIAAAAEDAAQRASLLVEAEALAKQCAREDCSDGTPIALLLRAGVASVRGEVPRALGFLAEAARGFAEADMDLHAAASRYALGALRGEGGEDAEGEKIRNEAAQWMLARTVKAPARIVRMLAPGCERTELVTSEIPPPRASGNTPELPARDAADRGA